MWLTLVNLIGDSCSEVGANPEGIWRAVHSSMKIIWYNGQNMDFDITKAQI